MATRAGASDDAAWPAWTVPVGLLVGAMLGQVAAFVAVLPLAAAGAGDGDITGIGLLLSSLGFGATMLLTIALVVHRAEPLSARALGLRTVALGPAVAWTALGAALIAAFVFFWAHVVDLSGVLAVPPELDGRSSLAEQLSLGRAPEHAAFGVETVASAVGRVVVPAVLAEIVLRGFALPTLARWHGEPLALAITAVLTLGSVGFALGGPGDAGSLLPIALLLGLVLGLLFELTRSLLPGMALSAAVMGAGLGAAFGWSLPGIALLSAGCCAAAVGVVMPVVARVSP